MKLPEPIGPAEEAVQVAISMTDDVFIKQITLPKAGMLVPQHSHAFDHTSLLVKGALRIWADEVDLGEFTGVTPIRILAGTQHRMLSLVDDTVFCCIHNTIRAGMVEVIEEGFLPEPSPGPIPDVSGMIIDQEEWPDFWRDGQALFAEHAAAVGAENTINTDVVDRINAAGGAHIVTARSNGRMFGYLCTIVGPSLEHRGTLSATATAFYASPDARGVGMKLLRETIDGLRHKGVDEIIFRAGVRGDGPRLGAIYRRLGAAPFGELYRLALKDR